MEEDSSLITIDNEYDQINQLYDECLLYLKNVNYRIDDKKPLLLNDDEDLKDTIDNNEMNNFRHEIITDTIFEEPDYETIKEKDETGVTVVKTSDDEDEQEYVIKINGHDDNVVDKVNCGLEDVNEHPNYANETETSSNATDNIDPNYETTKQTDIAEATNEVFCEQGVNVKFNIENELQSMGSVTSLPADLKSERLRRLSQQLPKIIITQSNTSLSLQKNAELKQKEIPRIEKPRPLPAYLRKSSPHLRRGGYGDYPKRIVSKAGTENVALISNVPFERIRLLNDTFHTLINLRWRWIVMGTVVVHFAIWLVFAVFWYITALAHYDFEPNPPKKTCITGGKDFVTIFLASVEAQTTIGFGDRAIDEECPETIFLFIMQLILGTGLSGVLTCVVYAKLTRPEKLSRDGVGFSKKALIALRDGRLCLMMRAWDLNYDHIISSVFTAHFVNTHRSKEGETIRFFAQTLDLMQRQFLLWPVTLVHVIDQDSPLYGFTPDHVANINYEITLSLKGASASMGTFTQSQTSYMPKEILWGHRFLPVVKYDSHKQKYVIDHSKLDATEPVETPYCSASELDNSSKAESEPTCPGTPSSFSNKMGASSFSDKMGAFQLERTTSFKTKNTKI